MGDELLAGVADIEIVDTDDEPQHRIEVDDSAPDVDGVVLSEIGADDGGDALANDAEFRRAGEHEQRRAEKRDDQHQKTDGDRPHDQLGPRRPLPQRPAGGLLRRVLVEAHIQVSNALDGGFNVTRVNSGLAIPFLITIAGYGETGTRR